MAVKLTDELRHVPIATGDSRRVEGIVRVRGIDVRVQGRGVVLERWRPVAVVVRSPDALRRLAIDEPRAPDAALALLAPVIAFAAARLLARRPGGS
ncbi:MAG: hypothetical protein KGK07_14875 [Chloroflexota bacterium]|nr:hypothetical protein [Chloroflexota bacterium]